MDEKRIDCNLYVFSPSVKLNNALLLQQRQIPTFSWLIKHITYINLMLEADQVLAWSPKQAAGKDEAQPQGRHGRAGSKVFGQNKVLVVSSCVLKN